MHVYANAALPVVDLPSSHGRQTVTPAFAPEPKALILVISEKLPKKLPRRREENWRREAPLIPLQRRGLSYPRSGVKVRTVRGEYDYYGP